MSPPEPLGVIGVGYVGLVTAVCFAKLGHRVVCVDVDRAKLERLRRGEVPIYEPGTAEAMAECGDRIRFTDDPVELFAHAQIAFVCVDTPPSPSGDADLSRVEAVIAALPESADGAVLAMKSTVPVGTGLRLRHVLDARGLSGVARHCVAMALARGGCFRRVVRGFALVVHPAGRGVCAEAR